MSTIINKNTQKEEEKLKKVIKTAVLILAFVMICCVSYGSRVSATEDFNDMGNRAISDVNKVWTLEFRTPVDVTSLNSSVNMQDLTDGSTVNISVSAGDDENSAKINPPSGGYKMSHNYKLSIDKTTKSKKGESLPKYVTLSFSLTSKDNNSYNALANVVVSPFSTIKQINVSSTNLPSALKYKIEGNINVVDIGKTIPSILPYDTVKVYLYDSKGNLLGTAVVDVSSTRNNISMNITLAN
jgi:hypothetical protein